MTPRNADPHLRSTLVEAAARILGEEGPAALTSRRLASEIGTSTMSVFSRFPTMADVRWAVREEAFARLGEQLDAVAVTDDPVADLVAGGAVFFTAGVANFHLYRAMFLDPPPTDDNLGAGVFERLTEGLLRCVRAERFPAGSPVTVWAAQLWSMRHGMVTMTAGGMLAEDQARFVLGDMTYRLLVGYGDDPALARRSIERGGI